MPSIINTHIEYIATNHGIIPFFVADIDVNFEIGVTMTIPVSSPVTWYRGVVAIANGYSYLGFPLIIGNYTLNQSSDAQYTDTRGNTFNLVTGGGLAASIMFKDPSGNYMPRSQTIFEQLTAANVNNYVTTFPSENVVGIYERSGAIPQSVIQGTNITDNNLTFYKSFMGNVAPSDPYSGAGDSDTGGGGGTFDGSSDPVPVPALPSVGATNTGFISLFVPTQAQLQQVANYLWSPLFDISTFLKVFENPMDCILGLSVVPVTVPTSGNAQITVGNIELSGISLPLASQQYVEVDCGSISFTDKFFGSYLDQDPYTKMALFVPYSGVHSIKADDVMGKTVNLKYHIDILTGSLVAFLTCGDSVLYEFNGACASNIPVNSMNYASTIENAIRIAVNIGTTVVTAGASAPMTGAATAAKGAADGARLFGTAVNMAGSAKVSNRTLILSHVKV